jgi:hypothetical protein
MGTSRSNSYGRPPRTQHGGTRLKLLVQGNQGRWESWKSVRLPTPSLAPKTTSGPGGKYQTEQDLNPSPTSHWLCALEQAT